ncbi:DEAD/DEAH box helicase family protein [Sphaerothrix gracilis]|uniref:DEAD/DEAH box helicase family protein n=1 Tax=Sphaerothrix gracilis TaxID=3151835 RepID=UPI0031FC8F7D
MGRNEADTRAQLIDPALRSRGWTEQGHIKREQTPGAIDIVQGRGKRRSRGRMDYVLRLVGPAGKQPVAVALIEAKAEDKAPTYGLEQAKAYVSGQLHNIQFVYATNGHLFVEYDRSTGQTSLPRPLSEFPTPADLQSRYEAEKGFSLDSDIARPLLTPYPTGEGRRRYYQDAAIRAALEKIAQCTTQGEPSRVLLSLATGAGKTFIAVNLLKRISDAGLLRRALFVCDRDELRIQASAAFQNLFGANAATVTSKEPQKNAKVLIATYQTLDVDQDDSDANFLTKHYPENYFSHIVIDECHRSAWGKWSQVLTRNPDAVQIGLTATPRQLTITEDNPEAQRDQQITADNLAYFGGPVYEYTIAQGMEDGYLAACQIRLSRVNLDDTGITKEDILARNAIDARTGRPITEEELDELYAHTAFENRVMLPDRVIAMAQDLFSYLIQTGGPEQKTIIFCVRDYHADQVALELNNLYTRWCEENELTPCENYAFKCTAASGGKDYLADLKGSRRNYFVATTVDLLTTGVDVPSLRNVVFFKYMNSPITFYQMVGRGTRIDEETEKLMFWLYDYTNATRLLGQDFITKPTPPSPQTAEGSSDYDPDKITDPPPPLIQVEGFEVEIRDDGVRIPVYLNGRDVMVTVEEYEELLTERLIGSVPTASEFLERWVVPDARFELMVRLHDGGLSTSALRRIRDMDEYDLYDLLAGLGYDLAPKTRTNRVQVFYNQQDFWFNEMPPPAANALRAVVSQFVSGGTDSLESRELFRVPSVVKTGGVKSLKLLGKPLEVLTEMKRKLFAA